MNKAILMSIQPKWLVKILNGDKTIDIRKTMPKCDLPVDVYLYCTKGKPYLVNGKVICKVTLTKVEVVTDNFGPDELFDYDYKTEELEEDELLKKSCLTFDELFEYIGWEEKGYAWHIDNLVIFDKPKDLSEFLQFYGGEESFYELKKAPRSWQYVYVEGEKE